MNAMKMEHVIEAPAAGFVRRLGAAVGDTVNEGHALAVIEAGDVAVEAAEQAASVDLDHVRAKVLIDMAFNLGPKIGLFTQFLAACGRNDWEQAAAEMMRSEWAEHVGARAKRLAKMMKSGKDYDQ